ncbi:MAG: hypothetical protein HOO67_01190 [Candidatus Peribacteraceae bacterium]|nr:hypothetical protein [Candidatus Peribacteraceae bacterium]
MMQSDDGKYLFGGEGAPIEAQKEELIQAVKRVYDRHDKAAARYRAFIVQYNRIGSKIMELSGPSKLLDLLETSMMVMAFRHSRRRCIATLHWIDLALDELCRQEILGQLHD